MKRPHHSTVVAYLALFFAMTGTAAAATGGTFTLGRANTATRTTTLTDKATVPLSVVGSTGRAPLKVNSRVKVANLDADLVDGLDSTALQRRVGGGCAIGSFITAIASSGAVACDSPPTPPSAAASCPDGQAIQAFTASGRTCVAVSVGSSGPSTPSQGQSKGWVISDVQISQDASGDFQAVARLTNNNTSTQTATFKITVFSGTTIVGTMIESLSSVPPGQTFTGNFSSFDNFAAFDTWTFQTDTTFNG